jgi:hypothetical protein
MKKQLKIIVLLINTLVFYTVTLIAQERDEAGHRVGPWVEGSKCGLKFKARKQYYYDDRNTPFTMQFEITNPGRKASFDFEVNSTGVAPDRYNRRITLENGQTYKNVETRNSEKVYFFFDDFCYNFRYFGMAEYEECSKDPSISKTKYYYATCGASNEKYTPPTASSSINTNTNPSTNNATNNNTYTEPAKNNSTPTNDDCNFHALRCNKKDCPCPHNNKTTSNTNTNTKPLTPQEIQQQQIAEQQQRQQAQYDQQLLQHKQALDKQLEQQRQELQKRQERQAYTDQYNDAMNQKAIANIQNTPITKLEIGKVDIKDVKKEPASGIDKATIAGIVESGKIDMEFPELSNKNDDPGFSHAKPFPTMERAVAILRGAIDWQHPETGGKMDFDLTIDEQGTVIGVSLLSEPRKKELEDKVSSQILRHPLVYYHKPAERNGKQVRDNISYSIVYSSSAELDIEKKLKWQYEEKKRNPRTVPLDNGQDYELLDNEELIETRNVTPLSSFSKEVILAKINELKNLPGDAYKKIKGFFDLEFLNNADLTNEKNNIKGTPTPSYSSDRLTMVNGVLHSVRRVNSKMSILTPIEK